MSKTLYRTYRPKKFEDVLGQDNIIKILQNSISLNRLGHAYLFTGPRGTGKTTVARIFATAINASERPNFNPISPEAITRLQEGTSMDLIEIDAASNTGVDDIRILKETVGVSPTEAAYKIYIIDEVHMLSKSAFNALLKTLEEPPEHAVFILATTEIHKVPDTIISRCQRFDFARFSITDIVKKLNTIANTEKINIEQDALEMIAIAADGGMRDAESILAQVFTINKENITTSEVSEILGTTTSADVLSILDALSKSDTKQSLTIISNIVNNGQSTEAFVKLIIEKLRLLLFLSLTDAGADVTNLITVPKSELEQLTIISTTIKSETVVFMIEEFVLALQKIKNATIPQLPIEIAVVNICNTIPKQKTTPQKPGSQEPLKQTEKISEPIEQNIQTKSTKLNEVPKPSSLKITESESILLKKCINQIEKENKSISTMIAQCDIKELTDSSIIFVTTFSFYEEKLMENEIKAMIEKILRENFNKNMSIKVLKEAKKDTQSNSSELLNYASQLMGGTVTE